MKIRLKDFNGFMSRARRAVDSRFSIRILTGMGLKARSIIRRRTLGGRDVDGAIFAAYSKPYFNYKAKKGRLGVVNLQYDGGMFREMYVKAGPGKYGATIYFSPRQSTKARAHDEGVPSRGLPQRHFFQITSEKERKALAKEWARLNGGGAWLLT